MNLLGFCLTVAVHPWLIGGFVTLRWLVLLGAVPLLVALKGERPWLGWEWGIILGWGALSLLWTPNGYLGSDKLLHLMILWLIWNLGDSRGLAQGMCWGMVVNALVCLVQLAGYWPGPQAPHAITSGLYLNRNMMAEIAAPLAVWAVAQRQWKRSIGPIACLVLAPDRAALVAIGVGLAVWKRWRWVALIGIVAMFCALTYWKGVESFGQREIIWRHAWEGLTLWGNGLGGYRINFPYYEYVHCDPLEFSYELGLGALPLAVLVWRGFRGDGALATKLALGALLIEGCFSFPLELPTSAALGACLLGDLCHSRGMVRVDEPAKRIGPVRRSKRIARNVAVRRAAHIG